MIRINTINRVPREEIKENDLHLVFTFPDEIFEDSLLSAYRDLLSRDEREKQKRFYFAKDRHLYLVSHALVRTTLSHYTGIDPGELLFTQNKYGRPEILLDKNIFPLRFNLSHTEGLAVCAVTLKKDIGVDVERINRSNNDMGIAEHFFSKKEVFDLHRNTDKRKRERFYDYWTLKESFTKAKGMGLYLPFNQFSFHFLENQPLRISFNDELNGDPDNWHFYLFNPTERHKTSLSVYGQKGDIFQISTKKVIPLQKEEAFCCPVVRSS